MLLSHSYFCVQVIKTLLELHRRTFSSRPSLFVFMINTAFHELDCLFSFNMHNMSTCHKAHSELKQKPMIIQVFIVLCILVHLHKRIYCMHLTVRL